MKGTGVFANEEEIKKAFELAREVANTPAFGPLLWVFGLPAGSSVNELRLKLAMNSRKSTESVWEYRFSKQKKITQGLYYRMGDDAKSYSEIMGEGMNEAVRDLDKTLSTIPIEKLRR